MINQGYSQGYIDRMLFVKRMSGKIFLVYIDDMIVIVDDKEDIVKLKKLGYRVRS